MRALVVVPRVAQDQRLELVHALFREHGIIELARAIRSARVEGQGFLGVSTRSPAAEDFHSRALPEAEGAVGLSAGLEYEPGRWSTTEEVTELAKELPAVSGVYISHERSEGSDPLWYVPSQDGPGPPTLLDAVREHRLPVTPAVTGAIFAGTAAIKRVLQSGAAVSEEAAQGLERATRDLRVLAASESLRERAAPRPAVEVPELVASEAPDLALPTSVELPAFVRPEFLARLEALPREYREAMVLRHVDGLSYREIAEVQGTTAGTVGSWLHRAREMLRERVHHDRESE